MREVAAEAFVDAWDLIGGEPRRGPPPDDPVEQGQWYRAVRLSVAPGGEPFVVTEGAGHLRAHRADGSIAELPEAEGIVQPLGADRWLVVQGRARADEHNARVYDHAARLLSSFQAGDAVAHVQTTLDARIWIGYFDEGVLSGRTLAGEGAVCLDEVGRRLFGFNSDGLAMLARRRPVMPGSSVDHLAIHDVYAMNVEARRSAWLHYYSAFPLVWIEQGAIRAIWTELPVRSAHSFAVDGRRALFAGGRLRGPDDDRVLGSDEDWNAIEVRMRADAEAARHSFFLVTLDTGTVEPLRAVTPDGHALDALVAVGRGANLFVRDRDRLYRLNVRAL